MGGGATLISKIAAHSAELKDPRMWLFYLQRRLKNPVARETVADLIARLLPKSAPGLNDEAARRVADDLRARGYHMVDAPLPAEQLAEIRGFFEAHQCADPYRPALGSFRMADHPPETHVAYYSPEDVVRCPHIFDLANNPGVLAGLAQLFRCKPTIAYMTAWWSFAGHDKGEHAELFHRDVDDWRFIKLFLYVTDVDEDAGPHAYVPGSHSVGKLLRIRRFNEDEVKEAFGPESIIRFTGPGGTCFLENTYGVHRGYPPARRNRLIVQVVYSLLPTLPGAPETPLVSDVHTQLNTPLDPYINRVYVRAG